MKTLKESILNSIDDIIQDGDYYVNIYKKANADWQKLLNGECQCKKYTNNTWVYAIKSPELVTYLLGDLKPENKPDYVRLFINIYDALGTNMLKEKRITIHLAKQFRPEVITHISYSLPWKEKHSKNFNLVTDKATVKDMITIVINNLKEYLQFDDLNHVKELIKQNSII